MAEALPFSQVQPVLDEPQWYAPWQAEFDASVEWAEKSDVSLPAGDELRALCEALGLPREGARALAAERASLDDPRIRRLCAHVQWMTWERYTPEGALALGWPPPPRRCPLLYAYAALGLARRAAAAHERRGIPREVTRATFWDIGQQVALHERIHGEVGMNKGWWLVHHLASHLFRLGRLQFQRAVAERRIGPIAEGGGYLDVHIPDDGPLPPAACDASFAEARDFFARYYPDDRPRAFVCSSWLLDPQLEDLLPESSNIVRFQRRFEIVHVSSLFSSVFEFVFYRPDLDRAERPDLDGLPRTTSLERALIEHHARGGRIGSGLGVIPLDTPD